MQNWNHHEIFLKFEIKKTKKESAWNWCWFVCRSLSDLTLWFPLSFRFFRFRVVTCDCTKVLANPQFAQFLLFSPHDATHTDPIWWRGRGWRSTTGSYTWTGCANTCSIAGQLPAGIGLHSSRGYRSLLQQYTGKSAPYIYIFILYICHIWMGGLTPNDTDSTPSSSADIRSCKQRKRYFSLFCIQGNVAARSIQSDTSCGHLHSSASIIFPIHHHHNSRQLHPDDNADNAHGWVHWVSTP